MSSNYTAFVQRVVTIALSLIALTYVLNVLIDPLDVFNTGLLPEYGEVQERLQKIEWLLKHPEFDTFLLGSSRIGTTATEDVEAALPGSRVYNLSLANSNQWDQLQHFRWLLQTRPQVKHIFLQVDYPETYGADHPGHELLTRLHPALSGESWFSFYKTYVVSLSYSTIKRKIANNLGSISRIKYWPEKGYWTRPARDQGLARNCAAYSAGEYTFNVAVQPSAPSATKRQIISDSVAAIRSMAELSRGRGVDFRIYVTPHHAKYLDGVNLEDYVFFLRELATVGPYWNFGFYSSATSNNCLYHESSHFIRALGRLLYTTMHQTAETENAIGHRVTAENLQQEVSFIRSNFAKHRGNPAE